MSLLRFALYFLSISACAVMLFPGMVPPVTAPPPQYANPFNYPSTGPMPMASLAAARKSLCHHRRLAPATIVASN